MVAIELQLISFALVVLLNSMSSVVNILAVFEISIFKSDRRWVFLTTNFLNIVIEFSVALVLNFIHKVKLIEHHNSKSFRMLSLRNQ